MSISPVRILQVASSISELGGLERFVERFSRELLAAGHQTILVEVLPTEKTPTQASPLGFTIVRPIDPLTWIEHWNPDVVLSHQAGDGDFLAALCQQQNVAELIHSVLCRGGKLFRRGDRICEHHMGMRCLLDWYVGPCGNTVSPKSAIRQLNWTLKRARAIKNAAAVLVGSEWMRTHAIGEGVDPDRVRIVNLAPGIKPPAPLRDPPANNAPVRLLFVGRLPKNKGVQYAIEAVAKLPPRFSLRIVGDGWFRRSLEELAQRLQVADRVMFSGALDSSQVNEAYRSSDLLLVPSIWPEPAGLVIPEARAHGIPVAAFAVGGIPDWISRHQLDGVFLARPASVASLIETIHRALSGNPGDALPLLAPPENVLGVLLKMAR